MWHEDPYKQCPTQIEYVQPKFKVLGHLSNHFCYLISNTGMYRSHVCHVLFMCCLFTDHMYVMCYLCVVCLQATWMLFTDFKCIAFPNFAFFSELVHAVDLNLFIVGDFCSLQS